MVMDIRAKAIATVMLLIGILSGIFLLFSMRHLQNHLQDLIAGKEAAAAFFAHNIKDQAYQHHKTRIVSLVNTRMTVVKAFAARDRQQLLQMALPIYRTLRKENPYFHIMHFVLPDGTSFLRLHDPEQYGDDLNDMRPMLRAVNQDKQQLSGYEVGVHGLFWRVAQPVFYQNHYVGAVEFGVRVEELLDQLRQHVTLEVALAVERQEWSKVARPEQQAIPYDHYLLLADGSPLFREEVAALDPQARHQQLRYHDTTYAMLEGLPISDFAGRNVAKVLMALDVGEELLHARQVIYQIVGYTLLLLLLSFLVLYYSFDILLNRIVSLNQSLYRSNQELGHAKNYLDSVVSSISDALLVLGPDQHFEQVNQVACTLLEYPASALVGQPLAMIFEANQVPEQAFAAVGGRFETTLVSRSGKKIPVLFSASPLAPVGGQAGGIVCLAADITDRKRAEQAMQQANELLESRVQERTRELASVNQTLREEIAERQRVEKELRQAQKMEAIGTLAGGIAHDFNNILMAILGYVELAQREIDPEAASHGYLAEVLVAVRRARDLVQQILTFSHQTEFELKPLRLQPLIKEVVSLLRATIPSTIEIRHQIDPACGAVLADPVQIHQVLMNLCTNAYHAMREQGGLLEIKLDELEIAPNDERLGLSMAPGNYLRLMVSDSGPGIPGDIQDRIFEPFFTTKGKGSGTGLGLSVVHGIVENHKGQIRLDSGPGRGTTFEIFLPRTDTVPEKGEVLVSRELPKGSGQVMLVDDESQIVFLLQHLLEGLGYGVSAFTSTVEALAAFSKNPSGYDMVLTDQTLPRMTGLEMAKKMLELRPDLPIVLYSGYSETINEDVVRQAGIRDFVRKPLSIREIAAIIQENLAGSAGAATP